MGYYGLGNSDFGCCKMMAYTQKIVARVEIKAGMKRKICVWVQASAASVSVSREKATLLCTLSKYHCEASVLDSSMLT